jgi:hypothetical protein
MTLDFIGVTPLQVQSSLVRSHVLALPIDGSTCLGSTKASYYYEYSRYIGCWWRQFCLTLHFFCSKPLRPHDVEAWQILVCVARHPSNCKWANEAPASLRSGCDSDWYICWGRKISWTVSRFLAWLAIPNSWLVSNYVLLVYWHQSAAR